MCIETTHTIAHARTEVRETNANWEEVSQYTADSICVRFIQRDLKKLNRIATTILYALIYTNTYNRGARRQRSAVSFWNIWWMLVHRDAHESSHIKAMLTGASIPFDLHSAADHLAHDGGNKSEPPTYIYDASYVYMREAYRVDDDDLQYMRKDDVSMTTAHTKQRKLRCSILGRVLCAHFGTYIYTRIYSYMLYSMHVHDGIRALRVRGSLFRV